MLSVVEVAAAMVEKLPPVLVLTSHWTVGVGVPLAAAVKLTGVPAVTDWLVGLVVMVGATGVTAPVSQAAIRSTLPEAAPMVWVLS